MDSLPDVKRFVHFVISPLLGGNGIFLEYEATFPFLDREFLEYSMSVDTESQMCGNRIEKWIITKQQVSDGFGYSFGLKLKFIFY